MQFRSFSPNYRFVPRQPNHIKDQLGQVIQTVPGLVIQFHNRLWDSEVAQMQNQWDDDTRVAVERAIMGNHAFGVMRTFDGGGSEDRPVGNIGMWEIGLAPGQEVPKEHRAFAKQFSWFNDPTSPATSLDAPRCIAQVETNEGTTACLRDAMEGSPYCVLHTPVGAVS